MVAAAEGTVTKTLPYRSYEVTDHNGHQYRWNRRHLRLKPAIAYHLLKVDRAQGLWNQPTVTQSKTKMTSRKIQSSPSPGSRNPSTEPNPTSWTRSKHHGFIPWWKEYTAQITTVHHSKWTNSDQTTTLPLMPLVGGGGQWVWPGTSAHPVN